MSQLQTRPRATWSPAKLRPVGGGAGIWPRPGRQRTTGGPGEGAAAQRPEPLRPIDGAVPSVQDQQDSEDQQDMKRAPLVAVGTVAGTAAVLAFPVTSTALHAPVASAPPTAGQPGTGHQGSTAPTTAQGPQTSSSEATAMQTTTTAGSGPSVAATGTTEQYPYGQLSARVTVSGGKVTSVTMASLYDYDQRSAAIDNYVIPLLEKQVISAGSANIAGISGATFTSQAFAGSVASALAKLGVK